MQVLKSPRPCLGHTLWRYLPIKNLSVGLRFRFRRCVLLEHSKRVRIARSFLAMTTRSVWSRTGREPKSAYVTLGSIVLFGMVMVLLCALHVQRVLSASWASIHRKDLRGGIRCPTHRLSGASDNVRARVGTPPPVLRDMRGTCATNAVRVTTRTLQWIASHVLALPEVFSRVSFSFLWPEQLEWVLLLD